VNGASSVIENKNENEHREAVERLTAERKRVAAQKADLEKTGLTPDEVKRVLDPMRSFYRPLQEEIDRFELNGG